MLSCDPFLTLQTKCQVFYKRSQTLGVDSVEKSHFSLMAAVFSSSTHQKEMGGPLFKREAIMSLNNPVDKVTVIGHDNHCPGQAVN